MGYVQQAINQKNRDTNIAIIDKDKRDVAPSLALYYTVENYLTIWNRCFMTPYVADDLSSPNLTGVEVLRALPQCCLDTMEIAY